jgi:membrane-associated phospholipid phosphatase
MAADGLDRPPLWRIVTSLFWLKAIGTTAFMTGFFWLYFLCLHQPMTAVTTMPVTAVDRWVGFQPWMLPMYFSLWFYVCLPATLLWRRAELVGFGLRMALLLGIGLAIFALWPTRLPSFQIDASRNPGFAILRGVDAAGNACPSLHVASSVFAAMWLHWMAPRLGLGRWFRRSSALWCLAIVYSTMAVKQHVLVDVLAGGLLGAVVAWLTRPSWLHARGETAIAGQASP